MMLASTSLLRGLPSQLHISRRMSTIAFVAPHDPIKSSQAISGVDLVQIWAQAVPSSTDESAKVPKVGTTRVFYNTPESKITAISSLGEGFEKKKGNERREMVRKSVGSAVKTLRGLDGLKEIHIDAEKDPHAASVAAHLALYSFTLKTSPPSRFNPNLKEPIPEKITLKAIQNSKEWEEGAVYAYSQNLARTLMELPANIMTPTAFCERVKFEFAGVENVELIVRDTAWAAEKGMNTFLSVTHGTSEPAKFLEIHYKGAPQKDAQPLAFVGKGITFDTGGISLKSRVGMKLMRGDMGGAASVVSAALAIAKLKLPVNLVVCTPLTENMPGPSATKPGDIVYAMNGKTVEVDNTDAEGRLVLSDAIYYTATEYKPHTLIDVATLTGWRNGLSSRRNLHRCLFLFRQTLEKLNEAGEHEFDRFWRMPLSEDFGPQIYSSNADLCNTGGAAAGSCTAALFLKAFAEGIEPKEGEEPKMNWAHLDIAGTMEATRPTPYQEKGMTGSSVRV
ncbi:hypothetical protein D9758_014992 [Tetrapyrgos nigripes]|uniref:Cytosol aminopeptidase domain-containing protein n=1 Tax=Tetrapyrgos nigripes TaxID=182062 RepID=A0A8H5FK61_9AGAR|nr:hypothetical protein D9758_014992 [Tetrapyrgos nigripes]